MPAPEPELLLAILQQTLATQGIDFDSIIAKLGQVQASEDRLQGRRFTLSDHLRGSVLSLLSADLSIPARIHTLPER